MQTFAKRKIVVAVGAALMVMAGSANAAVTFRAAQPGLVSTITNGAGTVPATPTANAARLQLLTLKGLSKVAITLNVALKSGVTTAGLVGDIVASAPLAFADPAVFTNNNVNVYSGTLGAATQIVPSSATFVAGAADADASSINIVLPAIDNRGYRIIAGVLETSADTSAASPVWAPVKVDVQDVAAGTRLYVDGDGVAGFIASATELPVALTGAGVGTSLAPTPVAATVGTPTAAVPLINGIAIDTIVPIDAFAVGTNIVVTAQDPASCVDTLTGKTPAATGSSAAALTTTSVSTAAGSATAGTDTLPPTFKITLSFLPAADWTNGPAADDALFAASPACLNTGLVGATLPVIVTNGATPPKYTQVFNVSDGLGATVTLAGVSAAATDGVAPVIVANGITFSTPTGATPLTNLSINFSEDMAKIGGDDLREVLENVKVGSDTLAAKSLNSGSSPSLGALSANKLTTDRLTINGVTASDVATLTAGTYTGLSISVEQGITFQEVNDSGYSATVPAIDQVGALVGAFGEALKGGVKSASLAVEAVPAVSIPQTAVVPALTIAWGTDTSALASASSATALNQIDTITVTFGEGKSVVLRPAGSVVVPADLTAATAADLAANLVIDVHGVYGNNSVPAVSTLSAAVAGSPTLAVVSTLGLKVGSVISGNPDVPPGTTVTAIDGPFSVTMSAAATASTGAPPTTFTVPGTVFQVKPTSAVLATADGISTIKITVPTALIYEKLAKANASLASMYVGYVGHNVLVGTSSTPATPIVVAPGTLSTGNYEDDLRLAGAEPVDMPLVFTAQQTGGQSTLLTQDIQGNIAGALPGSIVNAYLAYWADAPTTTATATITSGKITNPGDKVATDLAIEFVNGAGVFEADAATVASAVATQLQKVAPASPKKDGIANAVPAGVASPFPVYVKLVRSNDPVAGGATNFSQNYLNARAVLGTTFASVASSTPRGSNPTNDETDPVYEVMLNPNTGAITGRLTGNIVIKAGTSVAATANRGLRFLDGKAVVTATPTVIGSSVVAQKSATGLALPGTANINLLMGIDPASNDLSALTSKNPFVLLVLQDSTGKYTQLTSANPLAANYMPFAPDVLNKATGTGGIAKRAPMLLSVTDVKALYLPAAANWALYGFGNRAMAAKPAVSVTPVNAFPRDFVGLNTITGVPVSFWTNDGATFGDMALSMAGNQVGVATDLTTTPAAAGSTLSTIGTANMVKGAEGLAWANADGVANGGNAQLGNLYVAQATGVFAPATAAPAPTVAAGWSLVNVPGVVGAPVAALGTVVDAVIKVGAQVGVTGGTLTTAGVNAGLGKGQFTWLAEDGAMPALTAGEAVFVHAKAKGSL